MYKLIDGKFFETKEIPMEDILAILNSTSQYDCTKKPKLQLEDYNLGKPTNKKIKLNPKKASHTIPQAWENDGNWYYNFEGALLEAKTLGKKIPTKEEWEELIKNSKEEILKLPLAGFRGYSNAYYYVQGTYGYYWSSSPFGIYGYRVGVSSTQVYPLLYGSRAYGFSVRCLKN